jgi:nicotinamidase-related amidase
MEFRFIPTGKVEVPEIQFTDHVDLPARSTALIVVDMQNDFVKPEGNLVVAAAGESVPKIQKLLNRVREAGARVAFTQDTHFEGDREWEIWPEHCRHGSWGWQIIDELKPRDEELICRKNRYDAFYGTWLQHFLGRVWQVQHVVIVGTVSNICVAHTAASAGLRWYHIVLPADGTSALTEFDQALTLRQASWLYAGDVVRSVDDIRFSKE